MKNKLLGLLLTSILFLLLFILSENKVFEIHFVDEEDNFVVGDLINRNYKVYTDIFMHHQPSAYFGSALLQKITKPNSIYQLVKWHREAIFVWSVFFSIFIVYKYGKKYLFAIIPYEISKFYLFGNMFLSESIAVYPTLLLIINYFDNKEDNFIDVLIVSVNTFLILVTTSTLWPLIIFINLLYLIKLRTNYFKVLAIFVILFLLMFIQVNFVDYFKNVFEVNLIHYIPHTNNEIDFVKSLFSPFYVFVDVGNKTPIVILEAFFSAILIIFVAINLIRKQFTKVTILILILAFSVVRVSDFYSEYYSGFHRLNWYSLLIFISFSLTYAHFHSKKIRNIALALYSVIFLALILYTSKTSLFSKRNRDLDFYINYSRQFDIGEAIKIMSTSESTLFMIPDDSLIYWQSKAKPLNRYIFYYPWQEIVPYMSSEVDNSILNDMPSFIYCNCIEDKLIKYVSGYYQIYKDGNPTNLFINEKVNSRVTKEQLEMLGYYNFSIGNRYILY